MDLENTTPVPAKSVIYAPEEGPRIAIFTAKATFTFDDAGNVRLDRTEPFPVQDDDEATELGLLPRDSLPRVDDVFEVMLLGQAHAPGGRPVPEMTVSLAVGGERRHLAVIGDRVWQGEGPGATATSPEPFVSMPLTWSRALGGKVAVLIDVDSPVDVVDPVNPDGKGFDHYQHARDMGAVLKSPDPYPQFPPLRELPNLEDPNTRIRSWDDAPTPVCWAPTRLHSAILVERLRRARQAKPDQPVTITSPETMHRAHPDWVIPRPEAGARVEMDGLLPTGPAGFALPEMGVWVDVRIGSREERLFLPARALVLLPEERRFFLVYRHYLQYEYDAAETRAARVRTENPPAAA